MPLAYRHLLKRKGWGRGRKKSRGGDTAEGEGIAWGDLQVDQGSVLEGKSPSSAQCPPILPVLTDCPFYRTWGCLDQSGRQQDLIGSHSEPS